MKTLSILLAAALIAAPVLAQNESTGTAPVSEGVDASTETASASGLTAEIKIGTDVQDREIVGESNNFETTVDHVTGWTRILGANEPTQISHVWKRNGEVVATVPLNVQSASFRTFSRKTINGLAGNWTLEVQDASGNVIAKKYFTVGAAAAAE